MNITLNNIDPVNATLTVEIKKEDYVSEVKKSLKSIKDTASIPGFRPGKAPDSMIQKRFGESVVIEEVNKRVLKELFDYIKENNLNVLGEPLPNEEKTATEMNFTTPDDYEFTFDIALAPEIKFNLTKDDVLPYYNPTIDQKKIDERIEHYKENYGSYESVEAVEDNDMVKGLMTELNPDGNPKENGIVREDATLLSSYMKDEEEKAKFTGAKKDDVIVFNPHKAYEGHKYELGSLMGIDSEDTSNHTGDFSFKIEDITRYKKAKLGKELYERLFGEGVVNNKEELEAKIREEFAEQIKPDSDYKLLLDAKALLMDKTKDTVFPDKFLKRWLVETKEGRTAESIEEDYPKIIDDLRFHLIKEKIMKDNEIKVDYEEVKQAAANLAKAQFAQYGIPHIPEDILDNYVQDMLKKEETVRNLIDKVGEDKMIEVLKEKVTLEPKDIKIDDFNKLFE